MVTTHSTGCRCANCRARRATGRIAGSASNRNLDLPVNPMEVVELEDEERTAILVDPVAYAQVQKEEDASEWEIANKMRLAGVDVSSITDYLQQAEALHNAGRRGRGFRRILTGIGVLVLGVVIQVVSVLLKFALLGSAGASIVALLLILVGLGLMIRGIYEVATGGRKAQDSSDKG